MTHETFEVRAGDAPLVLSFPHSGTALPATIARRLTAAGVASIDTDWDVDRLYAFAPELGATTLRATHSRYAVDLNRDPAGTSLYPGAHTTGVAPVETFDGQPLYAPGDEPQPEEIAARIAAYWQPYHDALAREIERVRARHGYALVLDGHSIWGRLPLLFAGDLPDVNLGTNDGGSCAGGFVAAVASALTPHYPSLVVDGRFKGGYITRTYGRPANGVHAIQIELNQRTYLRDGSRTATDTARAALLSNALRAACDAMLAWVPTGRALDSGVT